MLYLLDLLELHIDKKGIPHEALKGKTPAEKCGIMIQGENKWKTVIENAKRGVKP